MVRGVFSAGLVMIMAVMLVGCGASRAVVTAPDGGSHQISGLASWYGEQFQGRPTASGEPFDAHGFTAAHRTLPFGTQVRVRCVETRRDVVVRINDRGPFVEDRVIDLSLAAARDLGMVEAGVIPVELEVLRW